MTEMYRQMHRVSTVPSNNLRGTDRTDHRQDNKAKLN